MKQKDLKALIKQLVRESITEIFAEMRVEALVENAVRKQLPNSSARVFANADEDVQVYNSSRSLKDTFASNLPVINEQKKNRKQALREQLAISDNEWRSAYEDTIDRGNPILSETEANTGDPGISERTLAETGLFKDYSKFEKLF